MISLDGSRGEGGGQILRTSLALSLCTGLPFVIRRIRHNRPKPGLARQHLAAVRAAARVGSAHVEGDFLGSTQLTFTPSHVQGGHFDFDVGSAGSATLVLQTILPALLCVALQPSEISVSGGTHNPFAPPFDFLDQSFAPAIRSMSADVNLRIDRYGFLATGGGKIHASIQPSKLGRLSLLCRTNIQTTQVTVRVAGLPREIAEREREELARLQLAELRHISIEELPKDQGPGNIITASVQSDELTETFVGIGARGVRAEKLVKSLVREVETYVKSQAPVGPHLADQLLLPMALGQGGSFVASEITEHTRTQIETIGFFSAHPIVKSPNILISGNHIDVTG